MTDRRSFIRTLAGALLATPLAAEAQQAGKVYRIGYLTGGSPPTPETAPILDAFLRGLRDLGWIEGRNIVIEYRFAEGRAERYVQSARELAALNVDVIVAVATPGAQAARQATSTIPIVMLAVGDPVGTGLIASLARPGGNVTGIATQDIPELNAKRLELLKQAVPGFSRAGLLLNATLPHAALITKDFLSAAQALHVQARIIEVRSADDFRGAFEALSRARVPTGLSSIPIRWRSPTGDRSSSLPRRTGFRSCMETGSRHKAAGSCRTAWTWPISSVAEL